MQTETTRPTIFAPSLLGDVDRILDGFFAVPNGHSSAATLPLDAWETPDEFVIRADAPGLDADDIDLTFEDDILTISGSRDRDADESDRTIHRSERWSGSFERKLRLPAPIDTDRVGADLDRGVLTITLPKSPSVKPRRVPIDSR